MTVAAGVAACPISANSTSRQAAHAHRGRAYLRMEVLSGATYRSWPTGVSGALAAAASSPKPDISENGYTYKLMIGTQGDLMTSSTLLRLAVPAWRISGAAGRPGINFYANGNMAAWSNGHWCGMQPVVATLRSSRNTPSPSAPTSIPPHAGGVAVQPGSMGSTSTPALTGLLEQWAEWKQHGLDYVFFDSGKHRAPGGRSAGISNAGLGRFIGGLADLGIRSRWRDRPLRRGLGRFGPGDNKRRTCVASQAVAGRNDWSWWVGNEDMLIDCRPRFVCTRPHAGGVRGRSLPQRSQIGRRPTSSG